jgi:pimeloyl-ACP methyl ester carboxylesterase
MGPRIGERSPGLAGLVLLAAPSLPLHETVARQVRYLSLVDGTVDEREAKAIEEVDRGVAAVAELRADAPREETYLLELPAAYWLDLQSYDPVAVARSIPQRLLVLQGGRDYQVVDADFARWQASFGNDPRARLVVYPELNHLFIAGEGASTPQEYFEAGHVDARVIDDVADWILDKPVPGNT